MSIIAALWSEKADRAWIGSDTMMCSGNLRQTVGPKWVVRQPWAAGIAGHLRTLNLFQHHGDELLHDLGGPYEFAQRARDLLRADGYSFEKNDAGPSMYGQMLILACPRGVWTVGGDFSVVATPAGRLWAEGSGRELALGAAHALLHAGVATAHDETVRHAIAAAIALDTTCGGSPWVDQLVAPAAAAGGAAVAD